MALKSPLINVMQAVARKAGRGLMRDFGEVENLQVSRKGPGDFVSRADLRTEQLLKEELHRVRPKFGFVMEESDPVEGEDANRRWIVDPLDGTTNFLHGIPHFAISIALQEGRDIVAGLVYQPLTDEMFWAERGQGAYLNERRLRVASRHDLADAVITTGIPHLGREGSERYMRELALVAAQVAGIRRLGAAALDLAYVAAGRCDGFWEQGLGVWDIAAGMLIVREAGGFVSDTGGGDRALATGDVLAANSALHGRLLRLLNEARRSGASQPGAAP